MRRWLIGLTVGALAVGLAGCGASAGDGDLFNEWAAMPEAVVPRPVVGACYSGTVTTAFDVDAGNLSAAECSADHVSETVHVGDFPEGAAPPAATAPATRTAFAACDKAAREYLGDDWRAGRLVMLFMPVNERQWAGGGRFYRCDLVEVSSETGKAVTRKSSAKDGLRGDRALGTTCVNDVGKDAESVDNIEFVPCSGKHTAEFSGVFTVTPAGKPYPGKDQLQRLLLAGCERLAGTYLGVSAANIPDGLAWMTWGISEEEWKQGDQAARCYVGVYDRAKPIKAGATIKGLGRKPIPR